ncbi:Mov34/MPN/PAD-1 family protein [Actinomadura atramentaria]|uniref:Mov34/MPN/PAD-1 family protein n=1 Tax=Actinomadura atramentaria TaxID=1990 RepID=UPI000381C65A|nr:M67 family metallopeptidase [Actinomadura atramentaria]
MLTIARALVDQIVAHARADHPDEACGVVTGPAGADRPVRFVPMTNAERSPTFYKFDPVELLKLDREVDDLDEEIVIVYHSHTATEAYPSRTDVSYAAYAPDAHYVLVSTRDETETEFRSFRIVGGDFEGGRRVGAEVVEEEVVVVEPAG